MKPIVRLQPCYDVSKLVADLAAAEQAGKYHIHWETEYHNGGWSVIPLVAVDGRIDAGAIQPGRGKYVKTPILASCPYFEQVIDSFHCPKQRVRLMRLVAGAHIHNHRDTGESWALGQVRLHLPIVTHEEVHFYLGEQRVILRAGELWYLDFSRTHRVHNRSPIDRVHLVLDLKLNDWLRSLFPPESLAERAGNWAHWCRFQGYRLSRGLAHATGLMKLRERLRSRGATRPGRPEAGVSGNGG